MNRFFSRITLLVIGIMVLLWSGMAVAQSQPVFRIGVLDDERGPISNGARLAVQQINAGGGVRGADGTFFRLELVIQPINPDGLAAAVNNLRQSNIIAALGPRTNSEALNGLPALQSLGVPVFTPATDDTLIRADATDRIFRMQAAQILLEQAMASYLISELGERSIATVQLDIDSTTEVLGFSAAATALGVRPAPTLLLQSDVESLVLPLLESDPSVIATFGSPALASTLYNQLRIAGWTGRFVYDQVNDENFRDNIPANLLSGILSKASWSFAALDDTSTAFLLDFVRAFGYTPGAVEAAAYDTVNILVAAISLPGELVSNIIGLDDVPGIQGSLDPAQLGRGEISNNVAVIQLGEFGAPRVVARYAGGLRLPDDVPSVGRPDLLPTIAATPTPDGVVITVTGRPFQNVRSGPSTQYDILGQLRENEQARVIGANRDNSWVVIEFRGQNGWLSAPLLEIFGNLNTVPIIDPPPTPTPGFTPTPVPPQEADLIIDSAVAIPSPIIPGQPFNVSLVVRNAGNTAAGQFAIAATFPPNNVYSAVIVPAGLGPGQTTTAVLSGTLTNTGFYTVVIVVDLNNEVPEGPTGEANNNFNFSYAVNKPLLNQGVRTYGENEVLELEGNGVQGDARWTGTALEALGTARLAVIPNVTLDTVHWDLINPAIVNQASVPRTSMNAGTIIGIITADGNRGAIRVDDIPGNQFTVTYRVYQN